MSGILIHIMLLANKDIVVINLNYAIMIIMI